MPEDHDLAALAQEARAAIEQMRQALASGHDVLIIDAIHHQVDLAAALEKAAATDQVRRETWLDGYAAAEAACPVPLREPRKPGGHRRERPSYLKPLGIALAAAWSPVRQVLHHGPVAKAIAVPSVKVAAFVTAGTAAVAVAGTVAVVTLAPSHAGTGAAGGTGAAPAASIEGATPIGSPGFIAHVTKPGLDSKSSRQQNDPDGALAPALPPSAPATSGAPAAAAPASPPSPDAPAGPAVLTVDAPATIDLSGGGTFTITISASGAGWASWRVDTSGADLDFSKMSQVLLAGDTYQLVVSLDPSQDGAAQQTFTVAGQSVTVTLPAPVPALVPADTSSPSPSPSGT